MFPTPGKYVWSDSHEETQYLPWAAGQPDGNFAAYDCIFKTYNDSHAAGWYDGFCSSEYGSWRGHPDTGTQGLSMVPQQLHALCEKDVEIK